MLVTNTIYGSYQYLQYNEIEPRNGRPVTLSLTRLRPGVQSTHRREEPLPIEEELYSKLSCSSGSSKIAAKMLLISKQNARDSRMQSPTPPSLAKVTGYTWNEAWVIILCIIYINTVDLTVNNYAVRRQQLANEDNATLRVHDPRWK